MKYSLNRKRFFVGIVGVVFVFFIVAFYFLSQRNRTYPEGVYIGDKLYLLEFALTKEQRVLGLGGRDRLCERRIYEDFGGDFGCAMAFPFELPGKHAFWMKDMRFPLDIVWLSSDGVVVHIEHRVSQESQEVYRPKERATQVLEFNAGVLDDVRVGEKLRFFSPQLL